jgi:hypothetical protein
MKFMVTDAREWRDHRPPCAGAIKETYTRIDTRTVDDPQKIPAYRDRDPSWWYREGRNHRIANGKIARDFDDEAWFIEISTLEELKNLLDHYGPIGMTWASQNPDIYEIELATN